MRFFRLFLTNLDFQRSAMPSICAVLHHEKIHYEIQSLNSKSSGSKRGWKICDELRLKFRPWRRFCKIFSEFVYVMRWQDQACSTIVCARRRRAYTVRELISLIIHKRDAIFSWKFVKSWLSEVGNAINLCGFASRKNPLKNSKSQFEVFWPKKGLEDLWRIEAEISPMA